MKIKLRVTVTPGSEPVEVITNLLCITEWERTENRKVTDGRGIGLGDMVSWAFFMFKQSGRLIPQTTAQEWLKANPEMEIESVDQTDPNPTGAAATAAN
jgi:hypothetical protein